MVRNSQLRPTIAALFSKEREMYTIQIFCLNNSFKYPINKEKVWPTGSFSKPDVISVYHGTIN